jgi:hypothetical protein
MSWGYGEQDTMEDFEDLTVSESVEGVEELTAL